MLWTYPASKYKDDSLPKPSIWRPLWDSINYSTSSASYISPCMHTSLTHATADFGHEIFGFITFFICYLLGRPNMHTPKGNSYPTKSSYQSVQIPQASTSGVDLGDTFGLWDPENNGGKKKKVSTHKNSSSDDEESQVVLVQEYDVREDSKFVGQGWETGRYEHSLLSFSEIGGDIPMWDVKDGK
ncbi:hypothetical protein M422DRAFT_248396 [Sphaerobolus stellatus SS14]|uniref:Uncharacterized protein n=1 Tax=Sphaerobolus stellatus (strain SS14) TaxID=990650 RepID=A0A0C9VVT9_SPHS4|nr:hypothetical protein M422DRAFT_248396 [Sphaerobolus stellatus SS14]